MEIDRGIEAVLDDNENPDRHHILNGIAFNLGFNSVEDFIDSIVNAKSHIKPAVARKQLEQRLLKFHGDQAWIRLHTAKK